MKNSNNFGYAWHDDKILILMQSPYITCTQGHEHYEAHAVDVDNNEYLVRWEITIENWKDEFIEESDMCDWDNYTVTPI